MQVIEYEANRQVDVIEGGGTIDQETRLFDVATGTTRTMRSKEDAHDYRYFPDPDLLPVELEDDFLESCRASLPELPDAKRKRYVEELGLSDYNAATLTAEVETFARFETLLGSVAEALGKSEAKVATLVANWSMSIAPGVIKSIGDEANLEYATAEAQAAILKMQDAGEISGPQAKEIYEIVLRTGRAPAEIADAEGLKQVSDTGAIEAAIDDILANNADKVEQYKGGKDKLFGFFVGQTMKAMQGKANPQVVNELLKGKLG
jgi:aspartyl-tRNA(Asn)/glutamyl-tRNA(Gln) amidotransferase subunit B